MKVNVKKLGSLILTTTVGCMSAMPVSADKLYGDVSGDGYLTAVDSSLILTQVLNGGVLSDDSIELGKVSGSDELTINDAVLVLQKVLDLKNTFPVEVNGGGSDTDNDTSESTTESVTENTTDSSESETEGSTESTETTTAEATITLADNGSVVDGSGAVADNTNNIITITQAGVYTISGTLSDGQIIINSDNDVEIILNGVDITSSKGSPFYALNGDMDLKLQKGTTNTLTDVAVYTDVDAEDGEPDACLFSKDRITIKGAGELVVNGNASDGIASKDELKIKNGKVTVNAVDNGIRAKDYISISGGTINVTSGGNGIKCTKNHVIINEDDKAVDITINAGNNGIKAETYMTIDGGTINATANNNTIASGTGDLVVNGGTITCTAKGTDTENYNYDGLKSSSASVIINGGTIVTDVSQDSIQGAVNVDVEGGNLNLTSGDNGITSDAEILINGGETTISAVGKGVKATTDLNIKSGTLNITSTDDSVHSNGTITIDNGTIIASTGDDGVHADDTLTVNGGNITISKSYEGLEAVYITINDGNISVVASDDGINANGGADNSGMGGNDQNTPWGRPSGGLGGSSSSGSSGGSDSSSGSSSSSDSTETPLITINGGYIFINASGDGIDSNGNIIVNGGTTVVDGPSSNGDGALDCGDNNNTITYNGGLLLAVGSSGMDEAPSVSDTGAKAIKYRPSSSISSGTLTTICDSNGNVLAAYKNKKTVQSIVFGAEGLTSGSTVTINQGGTYSGELDANGFATGGTVSGATQLGTLTISSSSVTTSNASSGSNTRP